MEGLRSKAKQVAERIHNKRISKEFEIIKKSYLQVPDNSALTQGLGFCPLGSKTPAWVLTQVILPECFSLEELEAGETPPWVAILTLGTRDLPHLMKDGLHWNRNNVVAKKGFCVEAKQSPHPPRRLGRRNCEFVRFIHLSDTERPPMWVARLEVCSNDMKSLSNFRVQHLLVQNVSHAVAINEQGFSAYRFERSDPEKNYNALLDDMPRKGWWPREHDEAQVNWEEIKPRVIFDGVWYSRAQRTETGS